MTTTVYVTASCDDKTEVVVELHNSNGSLWMTVLDSGEEYTDTLSGDLFIVVKETPKFTSEESEESGGEENAS